MDIGDGILNFSESFNGLPPEILARVDSLFVILKAAGIAFIVYVLYLLLMAFLNYKNIRRMRHIEKTVLAVDEKLDELLGKSKLDKKDSKKNKKSSKKSK